MKSIPTGLTPAAACRWLILTAMILLHRREEYWCVMGGSASGMGPWGIAATGRYRSSQQRNYHSDPSIVGEKAAVASWNPNTRRQPILAAVSSLKQQNQQRTSYESIPTTTGLPRGGGFGNLFRNGITASDSNPFDSPPPSFVRTIGTITQLLISAGKAVLPPLVGFVRGIVLFYRALPMDAIRVQIGLVYCFLGGYYPTLFSSLQAAKHCGWNVAVAAISDLTDEAIKVIDEIEETGMDWDDLDGYGYYEDDDSRDSKRKRNTSNKRALFLRQTHIVLTTVDPAKINTAAGALYTTWLGISTILRREYARVINLALTLAEALETAFGILLVPALNLVTPRDYRRWVPVLLGWAAKAASMRLAWRIERVLTAATSAIAGGAMVARSLPRMLTRYRNRAKRGNQREEELRHVVISKSVGDENDGDEHEYDDVDDETKRSVGEQVVGFAIGGLGFYTQMESQYRQKFSFAVPFPMSLMTFPFDLAERWIQWYITEHPS